MERDFLSPERAADNNGGRGDAEPSEVVAQHALNVSEICNHAWPGWRHVRRARWGRRCSGLHAL